MRIGHIGIHESVGTVFPPEALRTDLESLDQTVSVVRDDADLDDVDALVTFAYREAFLDGDLDWVHSVQAGIDRFPLDAFEERGIVLTNSTGIHGESVGETGVGLMLTLARRLHTYSRNQTTRTWDRPEWDEPFTLGGESLCVVGLGTLGRGIAERAAALGMHVTGVRRTPEPVDGVETVYGSDDLHEAIADATFVALAVPLTDATEHLVGAPELDAMRDDAYLVNVARGGVVDQPALVEALERGELAGAALDVFEEEPLPEDSPLWGMDEVVVTPHAAAATRDYYRDIAALVRENVDHLAADEPLTNRVV